MTLDPGARLGPYEILAPIGAGGMGEVYRAHDPRMGRDVAIRVSADRFSERFDREVRAVAALNHPNICQIYDVGPNYLVMELIEGDTLGDRIQEAAISFEEAIHLARQICDALEAAHEKGIVHRDLKPGNIKIKPDGTVKVLDFGLAKVDAPAAASQSAPTLTMPATEAGVILGTAAYMSPEQARGKIVDKRSDIWAFGVVLYEMLTRQRLFRGDSVADILVAVLNQEPEWSRVPSRAVPLLRRCLERDPKNRLRDIGDAMAWLNAGQEPAGRSRPVVLPWIAAGVLAAALVAVFALPSMRTLWQQTPDRPVVRLNVDLGPDAESSASSTLAISPDGSRIVFLKRAAGGTVMLASRLLNESKDTILPGTEGASDPFFSPDGLSIGFFTATKMYKTTLNGGSPVFLAEAASPRGASWSEDGNIAAALFNVTGLSLLPAAGGTPRVLTQAKPGEATHRWPQILPGGQAAIFTNSSNIDLFEEASIDAVMLKTGERRTLLRGGYYGRYVPSNGSKGHLVFVRQGSLFAVKFDPARLEVQGAPVSLLDDVASNPTTAGGHFDFSQALSGSGILAYRSGQPSSPAAWPVAWLDSSGKIDPFIAKPGVYFTPRLSPDGRQLALTVTGSQGADLFVYDFRSDNLSARTFTGQDNTWPLWTPDGRYIIYRSSRPKEGIYVIPSGGSGEPQLLLEAPIRVIPTSLAPGAKRLAYQSVDPLSANDLWTVPLDWSDPGRPKAGTPELFERTPGNERTAVFSPDGRWIAYESNVSGRTGIYVRAFPASGGKWLISASGTYPLWSNNGRELFFENAGDNRIWVVDYTAKDGVFMPGKPRLWSPALLRDNGSVHKDLAPDGKRFVVFPMPAPQAKESNSVHITFLLNFFDELRRKFPAGE